MARNVPTRWRNPLGRFRSMTPWHDREREGQEDFWAPSTMLAESVPTIDMDEDDNEIRITAEMPGLDKDDFKVEVLGNRLQIRGEKKEEHEKKEQGYYYSERSYGSFSRTIQLPSEVKPEEAKAEYKNGVLKLHLPKSETAKAKAIKVDVS